MPMSLNSLSEKMRLLGQLIPPFEIAESLVQLSKKVSNVAVEFSDRADTNFPSDEIENEFNTLMERINHSEIRQAQLSINRLNLLLTILENQYKQYREDSKGNFITRFFRAIWNWIWSNKPAQVTSPSQNSGASVRPVTSAAASNTSARSSTRSHAVQSTSTSRMAGTMPIRPPARATTVTCPHTLAICGTGDPLRPRMNLAGQTPLTHEEKLRAKNFGNSMSGRTVRRAVKGAG